MDSPTRKIWTAEEVHDRFGGPTADQQRLILRHMDKLEEARTGRVPFGTSRADRFRQLVEAFKLTTFADPTGCVVRVTVPGIGPKTLTEAQREWVVASVTDYWNDLGQHEDRPTASSYARWRAKYNKRGQPNPYIGRAALDSYVKGSPGYGTDGAPLPAEPDQDWRIQVTVGKTTRLERPLEAALRVAGLT